MPYRMIDWACAGHCGRRWEELTTVSAAGDAIAPRCCGLRARKLLAAPAIRTNDNFPRDLRLTTTAGHLKDGVNVRGRDVISSQMGRGFSSRDEHDAHLRSMNAQGYGIEIVTPSEYDRRHLGKEEPPAPRLEDDPQALRAAQDEFADMYDRAEADALPPIETPMLDADPEGRQMLEQLTSGAAATELVATADDGA